MWHSFDVKRASQYTNELIIMKVFGIPYEELALSYFCTFKLTNRMVELREDNLRLMGFGLDVFKTHDCLIFAHQLQELIVGQGLLPLRVERVKLVH